MYEQLKSRVASLLRRPRPMKPQTERQLAEYLAEHKTDITAFLLCASSVLEDYELEVVFGPQFTPTLDERAEVADLLDTGPPAPERLKRLVADLCVEVPNAVIRLPDGTEASLPLHEVMVERFVNLLRLDGAPNRATAAALREALPADLRPIGMALACERGMTPAHQAWFAAFIRHVAERRKVTRALLATTADFIASQRDLNRDTLLAAAESLLRATQGTAAYAAGGHAYWSPDVAQHHHYRGQGKVDTERVQQRQTEIEHVTALVEALQTFDYEAPVDS